jgi:hypothetical protein
VLFLDGAGAFPVRRGQADVEAIETAVRLAREGNVVAMFPEGTRRRKGLVKKFETCPSVASWDEMTLVTKGCAWPSALTAMPPSRSRYCLPSASQT